MSCLFVEMFTSSKNNQGCPGPPSKEERFNPCSNICFSAGHNLQIRSIRITQICNSFNVFLLQQTEYHYLHSSDQVRHGFRHCVVSCARVALAAFIEQLHELCRKPASQSVQLPDPTVLILLRYNLQIRPAELTTEKRNYKPHRIVPKI